MSFLSAAPPPPMANRLYFKWFCLWYPWETLTYASHDSAMQVTGAPTKTSLGDFFVGQNKDFPGGQTTTLPLGLWYANGKKGG